MGKRKKQQQKNGHKHRVEKIVLATALVQLFIAFLDLIKKLLE